MNPCDLINEIIQLSAPISSFVNFTPVTQSNSQPIVCEPFFDVTRLRKYAESISVLYQTNDLVQKSYSRKEFELQFDDFFSIELAQKIEIGPPMSTAFFAKLLDEPEKEFTVLRDVHGVKIETPSSPRVLGPFTIYHYLTHKNLIHSKSDLPPQHIWGSEDPQYLIQVKTKARDIVKAIEKADVLFEKFELTLKFILGPNERWEVGVLEYRGWRHRRSFAFSEGDVSSASNTNYGSIDPIPIDDPYFTNAEWGFDRIWEFLSVPNNTELEKKLLLAIEWIGQSYIERSPPSAFLKSAIALEILFTYNEKTIINSSILSQISESIALLLGEKLSERLEIESRIKKLYNLRSSIAHAGKQQFPKEELDELINTSRSVVVKMLTSQTFRNCKSIADVYSHLKACKFSGNKI